jgi:ParB family chromosome partitioning protein
MRKARSTYSKAAGQPAAFRNTKVTTMTKTQKFERLPLANLVLPAFNPRQHEDPHLLEELAASIAQKGVLEPIIVRPKGEKYQIVAGARRFKASRTAKQKDIPAIVRELTDQEAAEFAVIENLQRANVHWLDEANGFKKLLVDGMTADALARRVSKPKVYIYQRLALTRLIPKLQKLAYEAKISLGVGLLLGRLTPKVQGAATEELGKYGRLTVSEVKSYIEQHVYLDLSQAPFDTSDASFVPGAGACIACPKRTGASPLLFADIKAKDTCTDPVCFQAKCQALITQQQEKYPQALKIAYGDVEWGDRERLSQEAVIFQDRGYSSYGDKEPHWQQSSAGACDFTQDAIVVAGDRRRLGEHKLVCAEPRCPIHASARGGQRVPKQPGVLNEERARQIEELWQRRTRHACRVAVHNAVRAQQEQASSVPVEALRFAVREAYHNAHIYSDGRAYLESLWLGDNKKAKEGIDNLIEAADHHTLLRLLIDFPLSSDVAEKFADGKEVELVANAYGLDVKALSTPVVSEWEEKKRISYAKRDARLAKERAQLEAGREATRKPKKNEVNAT